MLLLENDGGLIQWSFVYIPTSGGDIQFINFINFIDLLVTFIIFQLIDNNKV